MSTPIPSPQIGIYGSDDLCPGEKRGCALWPAGYGAAVKEAGGEPVAVTLPEPGGSWDDVLDGIEGMLFLGGGSSTAWRTADEEQLCQWCQERGLPFLGVDQGLHSLNSVFGGTLFLDLPR